jgi:hypothetical protein
MTTETLHPLAPQDLPRYLAGPDGDPLFTIVLWLLIIMLLVVGNLYLKLHALPERMAHKHNNTQLQMIMVLALLGLFTHNNVFWVAALLLSAIRLPDFTTPLKSIAKSLHKMAATRSGNDAVQEQTTVGDTPSATDSPAEEGK